MIQTDLLSGDQVTAISVDFDVAGSKTGDGPPRPDAWMYTQRIVTFIGEFETKERFSFRVTVPEFPFEDGQPVTIRQKSAVADFFGVSCEFKQQAGVMLSAREVGYYVADSISTSGALRDFFAFAVAAYVLSSRSLRAASTIWNRSSNRGRRELDPNKMSDGLRVQPQIFARRLNNDLIKNGSRIGI